MWMPVDCTEIYEYLFMFVLLIFSRAVWRQAVACTLSSVPPGLPQIAVHELLFN